MNDLDRQRFSARRRQYRDALGSYLASLGPLSLFDDMRGNVGDGLIWSATSDFLNDVELPARRVSQLDFSDDDHATLIIPGSGAFHRWWHEWLPQVVLDASTNYRRVVILPSSYDLSVPIVRAALSRHNVFSFARDARSFRAVAPLGRCVLAPDMAIFFAGFRDVLPTIDVEPAFSRTLVALRTDAGGLEGAGHVTLSPTNDDISLTSSSLREFLARLDAASTVVTDRLHVALAAVLRGKIVNYLDPYDHKISGCAQVAFRGDFTSSLLRIDATWLEEGSLVERRESA
jgi:exopolysaccharide biosynthesis predicted pyruvyltransferase EpsI